MGMISHITKNTFNKIFANLAKEMGAKIDDVQLGIFYVKGEQKYEAYHNLEKVKDIELDEYCGSIIDFSGGTEVINSTIARAGSVYAKEHGCNIDEVNIIMKYNNAKLPMASLMISGRVARRIEIEKEFLSS